MNETFLKIEDILRLSTLYLQKRGIEKARLTSEILLSHVLNQDRTYLYLNYKRSLDINILKRFWQAIKRRAKGEPVAYIIGKKEFWSLEFEVNPHVLIPRPETELLVEQGIECVKHIKKPLILDIGTGSGAIAIALAKELPNAEVWAIDISEEAIEVAKTNAKKHNVLDRIKFLKGDLWRPLEKEKVKFHLIVTNPPYVSSKDYPKLSPEVRDWEPKIALLGGEKGLSLIKRIVVDADQFLLTGGFLLLEISPEQVEYVKHLIQSTAHFTDLKAIKDYSSAFRVIQARRI